jgi:hypothetical protein
MKIRIFNKENDFAIVSRYNAYYRYYDGKKELFFREAFNAIDYAMTQGFNFKSEVF